MTVGLDDAGAMTTYRAHAVALLAQIGAALGLLTACFQLFANWYDASVAFLGDTATVEGYHVADYRLWSIVGAGCLAVVVLAGVLRRAGWVVPMLLGLVLAASAALFHVALPDADPAPASPTGNPNACFSGSNDCPGG